MSEHGLLDREVVSRSRPLMKGLLALVLWSNSAVTTALCCVWVEQQLWYQATVASWAVGVALAVVFTVAQIFTKDASAGGYLLALVPDVATTALQWQRIFVPIGATLLGETGMVVGALLALLLGWHSARLPERMLFGRVTVERRTREVA